MPATLVSGEIAGGRTEVGGENKSGRGEARGTMIMWLKVNR